MGDDVGLLDGLSLDELELLAALLPGAIVAKERCPSAEVSVMIEADGVSVVVGMERPS